MVSNESDVRAKLFYRGYDHGEAVDYAEQIMANLNEYARKQDQIARVRQQREDEQTNSVRYPVRTVACQADPDKWFPELPPARRGKRHRLIAQSAIEAIDACLACPIRASCEDIGMEEDNLYHGIFGGLTAYERLTRADRLGAPDGTGGIMERMAKNLTEVIYDERNKQEG